MQFTINIGNNGIYTTSGDRIGTITDDSYIDEILGLLNEETNTMDIEQQELLEHLDQHKINSIALIDELLQFKEKHEANEQRFDEIYEKINSLPTFDLEPSIIENIHEILEMLNNIDIKQNTIQYKKAQQKKFDDKVKKEVDKQIKAYIEKMNPEKPKE